MPRGLLEWAGAVTKAGRSAAPDQRAGTGPADRRVGAAAPQIGGAAFYHLFVRVAAGRHVMGSATPSTCAPNTEILPTLTDASDDLRTLGDLGHDGESDTIPWRSPQRRPPRRPMAAAEQAQDSVRAIGERGNRC
ncbi:hypothetical protein [Virgisporangium aurantiacum]|uniref:Uncharacterized protein n=1 Tax=Virgisporangium aurantiacum TaxID=175570 RepID=A0A8J3ZKN5_9ACTN|nr:hypothetical protein [Virgisporangium aurantiacum]GIJ64717.1 hypothetical protein Vau01_122330 [Virgisporangium aurantiacum]